MLPAYIVYFACRLAEDAVWLQVPALSIFESSLRRGKFDANRKLSNGAMLEFSNIYPMDAVYDTPDDVPEDVSTQSLNAHPSLPSILANVFLKHIYTLALDKMRVLRM